MTRASDRTDWIAPFPGRNHHANWCADINHPDARLIAAAPELLAELERLAEWAACLGGNVTYTGDHPLASAQHAIAKAKGGAA